jgi:hypothetical protein
MGLRGWPQRGDEARNMRWLCLVVCREEEKKGRDGGARVEEVRVVGLGSSLEDEFYREEREYIGHPITRSSTWHHSDACRTGGER